MNQGSGAESRVALSRDRILATAVALADEAGIEAVSMRNLADRLDVVPMALYKHLSNKEALLDGMVDRIVPEIGDPLPDADWKRSLRHRILSARRILLSHPWASAVIESRAAPTPVVLGYMNSIAGTFLEGGFPPSLAHQAMHALGSRMWGFTQELFPSPPPDPAIQQAMIAELEAHFPHIVRVAAASDHAGGGIVGGGCDDQAEFEFALDLLLDGLERLLDHTVGSH